MKDFHDAMLDLWKQAKHVAGYDAGFFLRMVVEHGGEATAHRLLASSVPQYGFAKLWEKGRLDLTVEYLVLRSEWRGLFSEAELQTAYDRLKDHGFVFP